MIYDLPTKLNVDGKEYEIRSDFRAVLDIIAALNDPNLSDIEKTLVMLQILYVDYEDIVNYEEATKQAVWFIDCGEDRTAKKEKIRLMDWEQDFKIIVAPINRVLGYECRNKDYVHWWTFISAYYEIGESTFSNVVNIRYKKKKRKKLEKWEQEFYRDNIELVELKNKISDKEKGLIEETLK